MNSDKETQEGHKKLLRSTLAVSVPTLFSRIFGYLRDMIQAYYMGTGRSADAFTIAYIIPNLLRRLTAEGAMTAAFVPVFSRLKSKESRDELWKFANAFFFDLTVIMAGIVVLGMIFSPLLVKVIGVGFQDAQGKLDLTIALTRMMFPYIFLVSLSALAMAVLNSFHTFFVPALTPVLFNLAVITLAVCFAGRSQEPAYVFAAGVVAASGTLASLIPPSAILVIYAIIVEQDVGKLLLAGFIPGVFSAFVYATLIVLMALAFKGFGPSSTSSHSSSSSPSSSSSSSSTIRSAATPGARRPKAAPSAPSSSSAWRCGTACAGPSCATR